MMRSAVLLTIVLSQGALAQARVLSAPPEPSLLNITRQWSSASSLGDLRELHAASDYRELRVWGGYGLATPTQGVVLRRANGHWSAFVARVMRCEIQISATVADTASRATMARYGDEARRHCGTAVVDLGPGARIITTDSLFVAALAVPDSTIQEAWNAAERAGVSQLPPRIERNHAMDDAFMYVVELRSGDDYRASVIEHLEPSETRADQQMRDVYSAVNRVLSDDQRLKP
jgi:hypothetical protein